MAVTTFATEFSTQWGKQVNLAANMPGSPMRQPDDGGELVCLHFDFTQGAAPGDITSTQGLRMLPAGRWRVVDILVDNSAWGASATLSIGHGAYTTHEGAPVAAVAAAFASALAVATATVGTRMNVSAGKKVIDSKTDVQIFGTVAGAVIPAGATLKGDILLMNMG